MAREERDYAQAYVALGSNLDDPIAQVQTGMRALGQLPETRLLYCSSLYRTAPVGFTQQADFINGVCCLETLLSPRQLLSALLMIEAAQGRQREIPQGPRTLDLDLLLYEAAHGQGQHIRRSSALTLPHPRLHERAFVLYPLYEIAPALQIPGRGKLVDLLAGCAGQVIEKLPMTVSLDTIMKNTP